MVHKKIKKAWKKWPLKHTTALVLCLAGFIILLDTALMAAFFEYMRSLGYIGALIGGVLFVSLFTAPAAMVMLFELGQQYYLPAVVGFATLGAVLGDYIILRFFETRLLHEFYYIMNKLGAKRTLRNMRRKKNRTLMGVAGFAVISSPLPDEIGVSMLGISHLSKIKIILLCTLADALGLAAVVGAGYLSKT